MIRPPCEITDQLAVGTQNCFSTLFYTLYTNIKTSAQNVQNVPKCTIAAMALPDKKNQKIFWGGGTVPSPYPSPTGEGNTPSPVFTPLGAFGASIIAPSALGVPVFFHLRLEHGTEHCGSKV